MTTGRSPRRPLLRYFGGKWRLAPWVISFFPEHRIYVEPFGGAASVLLRKPRSYGEVYNDLDGEVVNLFRVARERGAELERALRLTPFSRDEYYAAMARSKNPLESARRLVVRSFMGFSSDSFNEKRRSGFRYNCNRAGTTPAHDWKNYPDAYAALIERLQGVVIENRPAIAVMAVHDDPATLFYVDPPYPHSTRSSLTDCSGVYRHEMTDGQHRELAAFLHELKGMVIISGYDCALYRELYGDWRKATTAARANGNVRRTECLWLSDNVHVSQGTLADQNQEGGIA